MQKLQEERKQQGWKKVFYFSIKDLPFFKISNKRDVLDYIAEGLGFENHVRLDICIKNKNDKLLIIIDDLHILADKNTKQLREFFLAIFYEYKKEYSHNANNFQFMLAGRYIASVNFKSIMPFHKKPLNPQLIELQPFKVEDVLLILESYLKDAGLFAPTNNEKYQQWSKDIRYVSCGNPKAILTLVEHIVSKSQKNILEKSYVMDGAPTLFNELVQPLLDEILAELPNSVHDTVKLLSIFEEFNLSTLTFLEEKKLLKESGHTNILETWGVLGTICAKNEKGLMFLDVTLAKLLKISLKLTNSCLYESLIKSALDFYENIQKDSFFYLYYSLLLELPENIETSLKNLLEEFKSLNYEIENFKNYLINDKYINNLLEEIPELEKLLDSCLTQIGNQSSNV